MSESVLVGECSDPRKNTNAVTNEDEFGHGKKVTFECRTDYVLAPSESKVISCNNGVWDKEIPSCKGIFSSYHKQLLKICQRIP